MRNKFFCIGGVSSDALMLTATKVVTAVLSMLITRLLSEYLSLYDYGTYSQVLLLVSAISSITIFGMHDGVNFFYVGEPDDKNRDEYVATLLVVQCLISLAAGIIILAAGRYICDLLENPELLPLLVFAVVLPFLQNLMNMFRTLFVAVGKARLLAHRNLLVSLIRLVATLLLVRFVPKPEFILTVSVLLDIGQLAFFWIVLRNNQCKISIIQAQKNKVKRVLAYCAPMAIYVIVNALNRDMDKYFISIVSDTETLALYSNASKQLPFDIIMASYVTVLVPSITRNISKQNHIRAMELYKGFLEIAYISTGILCGAALAAAPQLMKLLYSNKYMSGLPIFCIYVVVDLLRFTNVTLILSAAGQTRRLMAMGVGTMVANAVLNIVMYRLIGILGPAVATVIVTFTSGAIMLYFSAQVLNSKLSEIFDGKYLLLFVTEFIFLFIILGQFGRFLNGCDIHYFVILLVVAGLYGIIMALLNGKRLLANMKKVNNFTKND